MSNEKESLRTPHAINLRAFLLAALITCGLVAITWATSTSHIVAN